MIDLEPSEHFKTSPEVGLSLFSKELLEPFMEHARWNISESLTLMNVDLTCFKLNTI